MLSGVVALSLMLEMVSGFRRVVDFRRATGIAVVRLLDYMGVGWSLGHTKLPVAFP